MTEELQENDLKDKTSRHRHTGTWLSKGCSHFFIIYNITCTYVHNIFLYYVLSVYINNATPKQIIIFLFKCNHIYTVHKNQTYQ